MRNGVILRQKLDSLLDQTHSLIADLYELHQQIFIYTQIPLRRNSFESDEFYQPYLESYGNHHPIVKPSPIEPIITIHNFIDNLQSLADVIIYAIRNPERTVYVACKAEKDYLSEISDSIQQTKERINNELCILKNNISPLAREIDSNTENNPQTEPLCSIVNRLEIPLTTQDNGIHPATFQQLKQRLTSILENDDIELTFDNQPTTSLRQQTVFSKPVKTPEKKVHPIDLVSEMAGNVVSDKTCNTLNVDYNNS